MPLIGAEASSVSDIPEIAKLYSQLAGVLAGFAFAGIIALFASETTRGTSPSRLADGFAPLIGSFVALIIASLNYAIVAGGRDGDPQVVDLETITGTGLAVAGLMLLYSILVLVRALQADVPSSFSVLDDVAGLLLVILRVLVPVVVLLVYTGMRDHLRLLYQARPSMVTSFDLAGLSVIGATVIGSCGMAPWIRRHTSIGGTSGTLVSVVVATGLVLSSLSLLLTNLLIAFQGERQSLDDWAVFAPVPVVSGFGLVLLYSSLSYRRP